MRTAFRIVASLTSLSVIVQVGLAGYGAFNAIDKADSDHSITKKQIENGFDPHGVVGTIVLALMVILVLVALVAKHGTRVAAILLVLGIVQMLLAWGGTSQAWVGFLHGVNALAIAGIAGSLAGSEWKAARVASPA
ncbi:MAG: hypothetical protein ABUS54_03165 [Actinomycetota bacterium]